MSRRFGRQVAVDRVDLEVPVNAFRVLVGPNGAGKTTLLRLILGLLRADAGEVRVFGVDARREAAVRAQIGFVPERSGEPYAWLRVDELIRHHARHYAAWDGGYAGRLAKVLELGAGGRRFGELSKGQARRVQLLLALAHRPPLLVLDEPTDGLDPVMRETVQSLLAEHVAGAPTTVLVSTHLTHEMEALADSIGVMRRGRLEVQASRQELLGTLRRYVLDAPAGWAGDAGLGSAILRRSGPGSGTTWTVRGEEAEVRGRMEAAGVRVRAVEWLSLEECALALLGRRDA